MSPKGEVIIFVLSFILRLLLLCVVFIHVTYFCPDSFIYIHLARNIVENNTYGSLANPELFRVPFYPLLTSGFMVLFKTNLYFRITIFSDYS